MTFNTPKFSPVVVTIWRRSWLLLFLGLVVLRAYTSTPTATWTADKLTGAATGFIFFAFLVWILDNNARAFETITTAFERIAEADQERTQRLRMLRIATESLATTLNLVRQDIAQNSAWTRDGVKASETAAELAAIAADQRAAVAQQLTVEHVTAAAARDEIKAAIDKVHDTAVAAYEEANHATARFQDVKTNIQQLNELLLHKEEEKPETTSPAETSLQHIDEHTAAIDNTLARVLDEQTQRRPDLLKPKE